MRGLVQSAGLKLNDHTTAVRYEPEWVGEERWARWNGYKHGTSHYTVKNWVLLIQPRTTTPNEQTLDTRICYKHYKPTALRPNMVDVDRRGNKRKCTDLTKAIYLTSATSDLCLSNDRRFGCTGLAEALKKRMKRRRREGHGFLALTTVCSGCGLIFLPCPCCGRSSRIVSGRVRGNGSVRKTHRHAHRRLHVSPAPSHVFASPYAWHHCQQHGRKHGQDARASAQQQHSSAAREHAQLGRA